MTSYHYNMDITIHIMFEAIYQNFQ